MALTELVIQEGNPVDPEKLVPVHFLIDSGAIYSVVEAAVLEGLKIKLLQEEEFRLADGSRVRRKKEVAFSATRIGWAGRTLSSVNPGT
jgi:predicted aspartyl protease